VPVAATVNAAGCPAVTVWLAGCVVIEGIVAGGVAPRLVVVPTHPVWEMTPSVTNRRLMKTKGLFRIDARRSCAHTEARAQSLTFSQHNFMELIIYGMGVTIRYWSNVHIEDRVLTLPCVH
jgi:hypothetical protein